MQKYFACLERKPAGAKRVHGVLTSCASLDKCVQTSALVIALVCMSAIRCLFDTYRNRQRLFELVKTSYNQSRLTLCVRCTSRILVDRPLNSIAIVASLSSAMISSNRPDHSLIAKKFSTWSNLKGVISISSPAIV